MIRYKIFIFLIPYILIISACQNSTDSHEQRDRELAKENLKNRSNEDRLNQIKSNPDSTLDQVNHPDHDFVHFMISQHALAIELANEEMKRGKDKKMKTVAGHIIEHHQAEKAFLEKAARRIDLNEKQQQDQSSSIMHLPLKSAYDKMQKQEIGQEQDLDSRFKNKIIIHHQTSIEVAEVYIDFGKDKELVAYAERLVKDHQREIIQLQK